jgi:hypothetical protein
MLSKQIRFCAAALIVCAGFGTTASAEELVQLPPPFILVDENAQVTVDPYTVAGQTEWRYEGVDQLARQWFWYRTGDMESEQPINAIDFFPAVETSDENFFDGDETAQVIYTGEALTVILDLELVGGSSSTLNEFVRVTNTSAEPITLSLFQYVDFDLFDGDADDTVAPSGQLGNSVEQNDTAFELVTAGESATPVPAGFAVGDAAALLAELNDGLPTDLADLGLTDAFTGDAAWAFQWDATLDPGETLGISKVKRLQTELGGGDVPEPATLGLLLIGAIAMIRRR